MMSTRSAPDTAPLQSVPDAAATLMFYASGPVRGISFGGLWRHSEFVKLWAGQTISRFGSEISQVSLRQAITPIGSRVE